jgi:hypothetical protein
MVAVAEVVQAYLVLTALVFLAAKVVMEQCFR